jgi:YegS/Rv2252/BmrU family lipid kinase
VSTPADQRPLLLIVNPSSGGGRSRELLPQAEQMLDERRVPFRIVTTRSLEHGCAEALAGADAGELPVVMSGDGLIGQIAGVLAGGETPLGILPGGRGNDFARVLGIPVELPGAIDTILAGHTRAIDIGEVNGERFVCIASAGFDSEANRIANEAKLIRGNLVYAYAALRALVSWKPARFTVKLDDDVHRFTGYAVQVANSKAFGGGMFVAPDAELDDGLFDVVMVSEVGKLRFLRSLPKVFKGEHVNNDEVTVRRAARVEVSASRPFAVYADGEHIADLPAKLRLLGRSLRVIVPAGQRRR